MPTRKAVTPDRFPSIVGGFGYAPLGPAIWRLDPATRLQYRNLSLGQASGDILMGRHLRTAGVEIRTTGLGNKTSAFAFLFVLAGKVVLDQTGQDAILLNALDSACRYGCGADARWRLSHDAEVLEIIAGAAGAAALGLAEATPGRWHVNQDQESGYTLGEGPRKYFKYRDLGVAAATGRRIHIHVVRSIQAIDGGTGWHWHTMGQLFYVLRGWAELAVMHQPWVRMHAGDAMCVAPRMAHNVPAFSADYLVLEMCIPADYDTKDADPEPAWSG